VSHLPPGAIFVPAIKAPESLPTATQWFIFQGDALVVLATADVFQPIVTEDLAQLGLVPVRTQYLGHWNVDSGVIHCYSGELAAEATLPANLRGVDLRRLFDAWDDAMAGLAGRAKQVMQWDRDHQFCGRCGSQTEPMAGERAHRCPRCGLSNYPRLSPAIIIAITRKVGDEEQILLARNHRFPSGMYSVVAGFVEAGETLEECVIREVGEEVGLTVQNIRYFGSQPWPFPNSLMIGFTADYACGEINLEESEIADARWFTPITLPNLPHKASIARRLIDDYLARQAQAGPVHDRQETA
jgi:NAD+ diphosphatase